MVATSKGSKKMKTYATATAALIDHLHWLDEQGKFNSVELARRMKDAGVPSTDIISESLFRQLRLGLTTRLVEQRAVAACRVFGISVAIINTQIPDGWSATKKK